MSRTVNPKLKEDILDKVLLAISLKGLNNLSLRGIGREIGISDRMLVFHFQTYENLINSAFIHLSVKHKNMLIAVISRNRDKSLVDIYKIFTKTLFTDENRNRLLVFLEFYIKALRDVGSYADFFGEVLIKWIEETQSVIASIYKNDSRIYATVMVAFYRGLMLDWLATNDYTRILKSQNAFVKMIGQNMKP